jgi:hypothetical protein
VEDLSIDDDPEGLRRATLDIRIQDIADLQWVTDELSRRDEVARSAVRRK